MDKKTKNIIIVAVVVLAVGVVVALKFSGSPEDPAQQEPQGTGAEDKLPKIIKISAMAKKPTACSPCARLERILGQVQQEYKDKISVESHYLTDKKGKAFIKKYDIAGDDFNPFLGSLVWVFFVDAEGELSETKLDLDASKAQIVEALKEVGVE